MTIFFIERKTGVVKKEKVYGEKILNFLYGKSSNPIAKFLTFIAKQPLVSALYGKLQKLSITKKKILPFIKNYEINSSEFLLKPEQFTSFNDFFIRKLKTSARPIDNDPDKVILPADARYQFFENISKNDPFRIKYNQYTLKELLLDENLANKYENGSMVIGRLCPLDYHRFHFPCDGLPHKTTLIKGKLQSVNPIALIKNPKIFIENKRTLTIIENDDFGQYLYLEVGATNVGSIQQTFTSNKKFKKGAEKGYFEFGGSTIILIFPYQAISFDQDLLRATSQGLEVRGLLGQSMGHKTSSQAFFLKK